VVILRGFHLELLLKHGTGITQCRGQEWVGLYFCSPTRLHGVVLSWKSTGTTLPLPYPSSLIRTGSSLAGGKATRAWSWPLTSI